MSSPRRLVYGRAGASNILRGHKPKIAQQVVVTTYQLLKTGAMWELGKVLMGYVAKFVGDEVSTAFRRVSSYAMHYPMHYAVKQIKGSIGSFEKSVIDTLTAEAVAAGTDLVSYLGTRAPEIRQFYDALLLHERWNQYMTQKVNPPSDPVRRPSKRRRKDYFNPDDPYKWLLEVVGMDPEHPLVSPPMSHDAHMRMGNKGMFLSSEVFQALGEYSALGGTTGVWDVQYTRVFAASPAEGTDNVGARIGNKITVKGLSFSFSFRLLPENGFEGSYKVMILYFPNQPSTFSGYTTLVFDPKVSTSQNASIGPMVVGTAAQQSITVYEKIVNPTWNVNGVYRAAAYAEQVYIPMSLPVSYTRGTGSQAQTHGVFFLYVGTDVYHAGNGKIQDSYSLVWHYECSHRPIKNTVTAMSTLHQPSKIDVFKPGTDGNEVVTFHDDPGAPYTITVDASDTHNIPEGLKSQWTQFLADHQELIPPATLEDLSYAPGYVWNKPEGVDESGYGLDPERDIKYGTYGGGGEKDLGDMVHTVLESNAFYGTLLSVLVGLGFLLNPY